MGKNISPERGNLGWGVILVRMLVISVLELHVELEVLVGYLIEIVLK